jgi:hypothetical protein
MKQGSTAPAVSHGGGGLRQVTMQGDNVRRSRRMCKREKVRDAHNSSTCVCDDSRGTRASYRKRSTYKYQEHATSMENSVIGDEIARTDDKYFLIITRTN